MASPDRLTTPDVHLTRAKTCARSPSPQTALDRWTNEGGRIAAPPDPEPARETGRRGVRPRVLIAGGGVAGLETLLALRALAGDRVDITLLAPEFRFVNRSMAAGHPFESPRVRGLRLQDVADQHGARWHRGALDRVEHRHHRVVTKDRQDLAYDKLVIALGAHPGRTWQSHEALTFHGGRQDGFNSYPVLLRRIREGRVRRLAFVKPFGASWLLPLYDLALLTATDCAAHARADVELSLITPETEPLAMFGASASAEVRRLMNERGITLHTSSYAEPRGRGWLDISPGDREIPVDRIITQPRLVGPLLRGVPCGRDGFIHTDAHGRLAGIDDVFAAGDATAFPIKQGGLAAQQADAVAQMIALQAGVDIYPQPFRPILRSVLLTGDSHRYLRADISGSAGDDSTISDATLWWPPNKLCGRYLAPYLSSQITSGASVMPQDEHALPLENAPDLAAHDARCYGELSDLRPLEGSPS